MHDYRDKAGPPVHAGPLPRFRKHIPAADFVAIADVSAVLASLVIALVGRNLDRMPEGLDEFLSMRVSLRNIILLAAFAAAALVVFRALGLYDADAVRRARHEVCRLWIGTAIMTGVAMMFTIASRTGAFDGPALAEFWAVSFAAVLGVRALRARLTPLMTQPRRTLIVGTGPHALRICRELSADPLVSYRVAGFVHASGHAPSAYVTRRTLGSLDVLEHILVREHIDEVYVGLPVKTAYPEIQETIRICERVGVKALYGTDIFDTEIARACVDTAGSATPRIELRVAPDGACLVVKRVFDLVGAASLLILLAPLMLAAAIAIKLTSDGPVLYAQQRYGLNRRRFRMWKFRTMVVDADRLQESLEAHNEVAGPVFKMARDPRVTRLGRFLRRTSIDELPQLFNVLTGDMSLVGPRPLPLRDVSRFTRASDMRRFSVRPGLTCLWQVSGRSRLGFDEWMRLDLRYIDHWSLGLDFVILLRTIPAVIRGTGAS
jgi:exopolysaccharide biosynthesis polyprenyl glycosylphosphotransferase